VWDDLGTFRKVSDCNQDAGQRMQCSEVVGNLQHQLKEQAGSNIGLVASTAIPIMGSSCGIADILYSLPFSTSEKCSVSKWAWRNTKNIPK
jgi:hypothetical protein